MINRGEFELGRFILDNWAGYARPLLECGVTSFGSDELCVSRGLRPQAELLKAFGITVTTAVLRHARPAFPLFSHPSLDPSTSFLLGIEMIVSLQRLL